MNKNLILVILSLIITFNLSANPATGDDKPLIIGCETDYPPYCIVNTAGEAEGFSVDLIKAAAKEIHLKYEIKVDVWSKLKLALAKGEIDALPLVGRTPEREHLYDFTFPYMTLHGAIFVRQGDHRINSIEDLKNKELIIMSGDNAEEYARRVQLSEIIITTSTFQEAFSLLASGEHDAVIAQRVMGLQLLEDIGIESIVALNINFSDFRQDFCFAVQDGNKELLEKLNEGLAIIISNGTYSQIRDKWFSPTKIELSLSWKQRLFQAARVFVPVILIAIIVMFIIMRLEIKKKTTALLQETDQRKAANLELAASEKKFRSYVENAPTGIFVSDEEGCYLDVNAAACHITGYEREELIGMNLLNLIHPDDKNKAKESFASISVTGKSSGEIRLITKTGKQRYWRVDATPLTSNTYLGFAVDTTEKTRSEQTYKKNQTQLQYLFDNMISSFAYHKIILDDSGKPIDYVFIEVNKAFEQMVGIRKEDIIGKRVTEVLPGTENDPADWIGKYGEITMTGSKLVFENYSKEIGKWFSISAYSPLRGYFVTIFDDITERKVANEELIKHRDHLEELIKERTSELEKSNEELQSFNKLFIGREFRIKELRNQVAELKKKLENSK